MELSIVDKEYPMGQEETPYSVDYTRYTEYATNQNKQDNATKREVVDWAIRKANQGRCMCIGGIAILFLVILGIGIGGGIGLSYAFMGHQRNNIQSTTDSQVRLEDSPADGCALNKGGCGHTCVTGSKGHYHCTCPAGQRLSTNGKTCESLDGCAVNKGGCSHTCVTGNDGHYHCACPKNQSLGTDGKGCEAPCKFQNLPHDWKENVFVSSQYSFGGMEDNLKNATTMVVLETVKRQDSFCSDQDWAALARSLTSTMEQRQEGYWQAIAGIDTEFSWHLFYTKGCTRLCFSLMLTAPFGKPCCVSVDPTRHLFKSSDLPLLIL